MKTVFFDTEFTTINFGEQPHLMSIGCVIEDGREFYAELSDTWHVNLCSRFVRQTVIPLLQGGEFCITEAELAVRLKEWIEGLSDEEVILRSDSPMYDWQWVERLFKDYGWPKNLLQKCGTIYFDDDDQISHYQDGIEIFWKENSARQHHALVDAKSLLFAWKHVLRRSAKIRATSTSYCVDLSDDQRIEVE